MYCMKTILVHLPSILILSGQWLLRNKAMAASEQIGLIPSSSGSILAGASALVNLQAALNPSWESLQLILPLFSRYTTTLVSGSEFASLIR